MFGRAQPEQALNRRLIEAEIRGVEGELQEWAGQGQRQLAHLSQEHCAPTTNLPEGGLLQSMTERSACVRQKPSQTAGCGKTISPALLQRLCFFYILLMDSRFVRAAVGFQDGTLAETV